MKKFIVTSVLLLISIATLFAAWPINNETNSSKNDLPFKAYCPMAIKWMPSTWLAHQFEDPLASFYISPALHGCFLKTLRDRNDIDDVKTYFYALQSLTLDLQYFPPRYDLLAYFYNKLLHETNDLNSLNGLAELYALGKGVTKNKEKAKHMFRTSLSLYLPTSVTGNSCVHKIEKEETEQFSEYEYIALEKEQFQWLKTLCTKETNELFDISDFYMKEDNIYRSPKLAETILYHLFNARNQEKAWPLYSKAFKETRKKKKSTN